MQDTISIKGNVTTMGTTRATHVSDRHAAVYFARETLRQIGWQISPPSTSDGYRLPLKHADEDMMRPLDAKRPRANGFMATAPSGGRVLVDASGELPLRVEFSADHPLTVVEGYDCAIALAPLLRAK